MALSFGDIARAPRKRRKSESATADDFSLGLNTSLPAASLKDNEMSMCVNLKLLPLGGLQTREGITRYTTSALTNNISHFAFYPFDLDLSGLPIFKDTTAREWEDTSDRQWVVEGPASSGADELVVTSPDYKLYLLDGAKVPSEITTLAGETQILPFGDKAIICDGSYLKYWDTTTNTVKIAYDDGSGSNGYQTNNTTLTPDTLIKLYSGSNTEAGVKVVLLV